MPSEDFSDIVRELRDIARTHGEKIVEVAESTKSAHKRLNDMGEFTASVNKLAQAVALVAEKVELITERLDKSIERIERGQQTQGERIGSLERAVLSISHGEKVQEEHEKRLVTVEKEVLLIEQNAKRIDGHDTKLEEQDKRIDAIEKAPGDKWNKFTWLIFAGVVTAVVAFLIGKLL